MNRKSIHLIARPMTENDARTSNNLIELQGQQSQNSGLQPQFTMQPQFTSFNPYQQQAQQEAMQVRVLALSGMTYRLDCRHRLSGQGNNRNG